MALKTKKKPVNTPTQEFRQALQRKEEKTASISKRGWLYVAVVVVLFSLTTLYVYANRYHFQNKTPEIYETEYSKASAPPSSVFARPTPAVVETPAQEAIPSPAPSPMIEDAAQIKDLTRELTQLKRQAADRTSTLTQSLRLAYLIDAGRPFEKELTLLLQKDPGNSFAKDVDERLGAFAATGTPTLAQLNDMFDRSMADAEYSFYTGDQGTTWISELSAFLKTLVRVRPLHIKASQLTDRNILYKASDLMKQGDVQGAAQTLEMLPPRQQMIMRPFTDTAETYLTAQDVLDM